MPRKLFISLILAGFILIGGTVYPRDAHAVAGILDINIEAPEVVKAVVKILKDTLFQTFSQRIIDFYVDRTVKMIQNYDFNKDPNQITDYYKDTFKEAAGAAIGDVIVALDAEALCRPIDWGFQVQLQLAPSQTFSKRVECTLDDVLENAAGGFGFERFMDDFTAGGWLAYTTSLEPQNNFLGVQSIAFDELLRKKGERIVNAQYEAQTGDGILGFRNCLEWKCVSPREGSGVAGADCTTGDVRDAPAYARESPDGFHYTGKNAQPGDSAWICTQPETVTPGRVLSDRLTSALNLDASQIVNADEFSEMLAAIMNALINRAVQESADGVLRGVRASTEVSSCDAIDGKTALGTTLIKGVCLATQAFKKVGELILLPFKDLVDNAALEGVKSCLSDKASGSLITRIPKDEVKACVVGAIAAKESADADIGEDTGFACAAEAADAGYATLANVLECAGDVALQSEKKGVNLLITAVKVLDIITPGNLTSAIGGISASEEMKSALMCAGEQNLAKGCMMKSAADRCIGRAVANGIDAANDCIDKALGFDCIAADVGAQCVIDAGIRGTLDEADEAIDEASSTVNAIPVP